MVPAPDYELEFRTRIIDLLLERKVPINHRSGEYKATALMVAAQNHNQALVEKLLRAGADKKIRDKEDQTAYDYAKNTKAPAEILELLRLSE